MAISILIFVFIGISLFFIIRLIILSESESQLAQNKRKYYSRSVLFEKHFTLNSTKRLSKVISSFENEYPEEIDKLNNQQKNLEHYFTKNRDRYNYLIFKYQEELTDLRATGAKWFSKSDLAKYFEDKSVKELVEGHVLNCYDNKYLIKEIYDAEHPFELDYSGRPLKIQI